MACTTLLGVCLLASVMVIGLGANVTLEADDYLPADLPANRTISRGNAGNKWNVLLKTGESIEFPICAAFDDVLQFELAYSNDGAADAYIFEFDGEYIGNVTSKSNSNKGENWNVIEKANVTDAKVEVYAGQVHILRITIEPAVDGIDDGYGAEIDNVVVRFEDEANGDLNCDAFVTVTGGTTGDETTTEAFTKETTEGKA